MPERYFGPIRPDMDVCDLTGEKVGTVIHIYRRDPAQVGVAGGAGQLTGDAVVEVKTGFLGLGRHLYFPLGAVQDLADDCVFLSSPKDEFVDQGWEERPVQLAELS